MYTTGAIEGISNVLVATGQTICPTNPGDVGGAPCGGVQQLLQEPSPNGELSPTSESIFPRTSCCPRVLKTIVNRTHVPWTAANKASAL
ncbi:hypothetical protein PGTUg99_027629 [Puccinia graminis f. sp. tritici]|uniref:Uncharacterized protein n=1 Tax=Puccinia graminis f. sp. tritici TaxID=56615 RepID=A0A5B0MVQ3_PUCGR|nr:hypothetical protein PGTUg99_027629 [Puccinia graminis f. sp. tritici]